MYCFSSNALAEDWKLAAQDRDMKVNESFSVDGYTITLTDFAKNPEGNIYACMFTTDYHKFGMRFFQEIPSIKKRKKYYLYATMDYPCKRF